MAKPSLPVLTKAELRIMKALWSQGAMTVRAVTDLLKPDHGIAYTSVLTTLGILRKKGFVKTKRQGRADLYIPLVSEDKAQRTALQSLIQRFFHQSPDLLVQNLISDGGLSKAELESLMELIEAKAREETKQGEDNE